MQSFRPSTYKEWLSEIKFSTDVEGMAKAAIQAGRLNPNKNEVKHDVALVIADKYKTEKTLANNRAMLLSAIGKRYDKVCNILFKCNFAPILSYVIKNEPEFDIKATQKMQGRPSLGFVDAGITRDKKGKVRRPLGFVKKSSRVNKDGKVEPGLGFL